MTPTETLAELKKLKPLPDTIRVGHYQGNSDSQEPADDDLNRELFRILGNTTMRLDLLGFPSRPQDFERADRILALAAESDATVNIGANLLAPPSGVVDPQLSPDSPDSDIDKVAGFWDACCLRWKDKGIKPVLFSGEHPNMDVWKVGVSDERDKRIAYIWDRMYRTVLLTFPGICRLVQFGHKFSNVLPIHQMAIKPGYINHHGYNCEKGKDEINEKTKRIIDQEQMDRLWREALPSERLCWWFDPCRDTCWEWGRKFVGHGPIESRDFTKVDQFMLWPAPWTTNSADPDGSIRRRGIVDLIKGIHGIK